MVRALTKHVQVSLGGGGSCLRLLPTAGVCDQRSGASLRLLLTAGVCEKRSGKFLSLLLTAGVCKQCFSLVLRPLLTAGICDQRLDAVLRFLPTTGVSTSLRTQYLTFAYRMCMQPAFRHISSGLSGIGQVSCNSTTGRTITSLRPNASPVGAYYLVLHSSSKQMDYQKIQIKVDSSV